MKLIILDATAWRSPDDFYSALLPELGAPAWHGRNLDALDDSLYGGIDEVEPPFTVIIENSTGLSADVRAFLAKVADVFADARTLHGADVAINFP